MKGYNKIGLRIISMCLCAGLLFGLFNSTALAAPMVGDKNQSDKIYKWTAIEDLESFEKVVDKTDKSYRLLLLCGEAYSKNAAPKIQKYATFDKSDEEHAFSYKKVSEAVQLGYYEDTFYTRGSMHTPYIEFTGKRYSDSAAGDNMPLCKIYKPDSSDNKSEYKLCSVAGRITSTQTKLWKHETYVENEEDWKSKRDEWILFFPAVSYPSGYATSADKAYTKAVEKYVGLGSTVDGKEENLGVIDWDKGKYLSMPIRAKYLSYKSSNEALFKCYIGEEVDTTTTGSFTVYDGQSRSLSDSTLIEEGSVIRVEKGGTLFISGTCHHNGLIINDGGTIILQKGAVLVHADPINSTAGMIQLNGGSFIVRDGARIILDEKKVDGRCDISMSGDAFLLNRGIISLVNDMKITSSEARLENAKMGSIYCGYQLKDGRDVSAGYVAAKTDQSVSAYMENVTDECISRLEKERTGYIYNDGGVIVNEGTCEAYGY